AEIQIWTDVDGMMTTDPRMVGNARLIKTLTFDEASELAYFGAKVLHPSTILPAIKQNIPVRILNSRRPENEGTLIVKSIEAEDASQQALTVKSIACKKGITLVNVASSRMLMAHGFLAQLFSVFAQYHKSVDVVATSEISVSLTVDNEKGLPEIQRELEAIAEIRVAGSKAIICIVGEGMKRTPGVAARIFSAFANEKINIEMISEGASEINLTIVVDEQDAERAVRALHNEFFPG
ncbi:MAG: aspartate kinase, partial [Bacteroidetes bacterium]